MSTPSDMIVALNRLGVTCAMLSREIGVSRSTVHHWRAGNFRPGIDHTFDLMDIADRVGRKANAVAMTQPVVRLDNLGGIV